MDPISPIWGCEGQHRAAASTQSASQGSRMTLSLAVISEKLGYLLLSLLPHPQSLCTAAWGSF